MTFVLGFLGGILVMVALTILGVRAVEKACKQEIKGLKSDIRFEISMLEYLGEPQDLESFLKKMKEICKEGKNEQTNGNKTKK